jgi:hypothetical protein
MAFAWAKPSRMMMVNLFKLKTLMLHVLQYPASTFLPLSVANKIAFN